MEFFYNVDALSPERIKHTFVGRQWLLDDLVGILKKQPKGAGVQHVLIVAPRGMGKTTVFLMLGFAVEESPLRKRWQVVRFREESYSITDAGEFWMEAIRQLSLTVADRELEAQMKKLAAECRASGELESGMVALLKDWAHKHRTRLLLLVENFDEILSQIHSEEESSRLRNVLMNDGTVMLIAAATSFFEETRGYDKPLYNFFKVYNLEGLAQAQTEELLYRRAELDGNMDFREYLKANAGRVRALSHFTGGNPRLVLMLYAVLADANLVEVKTGLEKLLDEVTPYFKAKTEILAPQQRKILDQIARESSRTSVGQSPTAIAQAIRLTPNLVSSQLQRMAKTGYVRAVNVRGRTGYYTLSEPLFALWYQMRFGREARERMQWLVEFLRAWYDQRELGTETERLCDRMSELLMAGQRQAVREGLEYGRLLTEAMTDQPAQFRAKVRIALHHFEAEEWQSGLRLLDELINSGCQGDELSAAYAFRATVQAAIAPPVDALVDIDKALQHGSRDVGVLWQLKADQLLKLERFAKALEAADRALELRDATADRGEVQRVRGIALFKVGRWMEARAALGEFLRIKPDHPKADMLNQMMRVADRADDYERHLQVGLQRWPGDSFVRDFVLSHRLLTSVELGDDSRIAGYWGELSNQESGGEWLRTFVYVISTLVQSSQPSLVRKMIAKLGDHPQLFPLRLALEYLDTHDRDLIEKLSPEVRGVVEDIVQRLEKQ
ncbi:hypothetical protein SBA4_2780002 [Candidatus Sulfopaludibacter sp. SbA4]|nr:hypothetical protein SBA4_2780002 [Candidatus Sulfopaludibacter sp. SbA4]